MASAGDVFKTIKENEVKFVDLRFTDTKGKEQHITVPAKAFDESKFKDDDNVAPPHTVTPGPGSDTEEPPQQTVSRS